MLLYDELAEHYFAIEAPGRDFVGDIAGLDQALRRASAKDVLDIGCGSGEHVEALCRESYRAEGTDASQAMIEVARRRFPNRSFYRGDMRSFQSDRIYDAAMCLFGTFNYILDDGDIARTFRSTSSLLRPGGLLILEVWNSRPLLEIGSKGISPVVQVQSGGKKITRDRGFTLLRSQPALVEVNYLYTVNGREMRDRHHMRVFSPDEIRNFAERAGFRIEALDGDLKGTPFSPLGARITLRLRSDA